MWRSRIFWRLFGAYSLLLAVALGLLGWLSIRRLERHLLDEIRQGLAMKTLLLRDLVLRLSPKELQDKVSELSQKMGGTRITLVRDDGKVLADSAERPEVMENHLERAEIQQAKVSESEIGVATRYSGTVHESQMYVARRTNIKPAENNSTAVAYVRVALPLGAVSAEIRWLSRVVWTGVGLTLLLGLGLSLLIARRLVRPLVQLSHAADSIARGDYGKKVLIFSSDEVGTLSASFNAMSQACAEHIAQMDQDRQRLRAIFRGMVEGVLVLDAEQNIRFINEAACGMLGSSPEDAQGRKIWQVFRHRQLGEIVENVLASAEPHRRELEWHGPDRKVFAVHGARLPGEPLRGAVFVFHDITHLRRLERVRQDFVANVSHELKTPLAAIQATVETLLDGALHDPDHNVHFLERIRENSDRLSRLVHDLLTLGRIESGQEVMEVQPIELAGVIEACLSRQAVRAQAKNLHLSAVPPSQPISAMADEEALAEILDNLVDNAIKYTPTGGKITLRWFVDAADAVVQVEDTGMGIPEKDLPRVFERFYRVDKARSRELGGTGLGLSIVKHLVQALGGAIAATSELAKGTTFSVRLPLSSAAGHAPRLKRVVFMCVENSNRSQMAEAFARIHGRGLIEAYSAGSRPSGAINPRAVEAMREVGYELRQHRSKGLAELPPVHFDAAVTMGCGDQCPHLRADLREDWDIPDPRDMSPEQFRTVRDVIEQQVKTLLARLWGQPVPHAAELVRSGS